MFHLFWQKFNMIMRLTKVLHDFPLTFKDYFAVILAGFVNYSLKLNSTDQVGRFMQEKFKVILRNIPKCHAELRFKLKKQIIKLGKINEEI